MINLSLSTNFNFLIFPGIAHSDSWWRLRTENCALRELGLAHGTWMNKLSHLRSYLAFTVYYGAQDFPVLLGVLLRFIAMLGRGSLAYNSATNIISSIKFFALLLDPSSAEVFDAVLVSASLRGLKAQLSRPVHQKLPVSVKHLAKFHEVLDLANEKHLSAWCAMLLCFFGCLRLSNLVPQSQPQFDPLKQLKRDDIFFSEEFNLVFVFFKWAKTNQNSSKVSWIPISPVSDNRFNLKVQFEKLFYMVKAPDSAPLFSFGKETFHTKYSLVKLLDSVLSKAGLDPKDYSWHSFRRGSAMFAFELGLADSAVQMLGDWSSSAYKNYLEFSFKRRVIVAKSMSNNFVLCTNQL